MTWSHRDYFKTFGLSVGEYGEILVAQAFRGDKLGNQQRCFDVRAGRPGFIDALRRRKIDESCLGLGDSSADLLIQVKSKLTYVSGPATVVHCKDTDLYGIEKKGHQGLTHLAVVLVESKLNKDRTPNEDWGNVKLAHLLTHSKAEQLRTTGAVKHIRVRDLERAVVPVDGIIDIKDLLNDVAERPLTM